MRELKITPVMYELKMHPSFWSKRAERHRVSRNRAHINRGSYRLTNGEIASPIYIGFENKNGGLLLFLSR